MITEQKIVFQKTAFQVPIHYDEIRILQDAFRFMQDGGEMEEQFVSRSMLQIITEGSQSITLHSLEIDVIQSIIESYLNSFEESLTELEQDQLNVVFDRLAGYRKPFKPNINRFLQLSTDQQLRVLKAMSLLPNGAITSLG